MNWFSLLGPWVGEDFALEIAEEFTRHCPPAAARETGKDAARKLAHAMDILANRAAKYHRENALGWLRKTRLLKAVQARLRRAGYEEATINDALYAVVVKSSR